MMGSEGQEISAWKTYLAWTAIAVGALAALPGCNVATGVDKLTVDNKASGGTGTGTSTGAGSGAGDSSGSGASSSGSGPTVCPYPMGQWTKAVGGTLPQTMTWQGMLENSDMQTTLKVEDYLDCDGSHGINAILIDTSATWCGACQQEAGELPSKMPTWTPMGIKVITLMVEGPQNGVKATYQDAVNWKNQFMLSSIAVGADPAFSFAPAGEMTIGLPVQTLVDPRTMQVVDIQEGFSGDYSKLLNLAQTNAMP